jgi:hypothetical protein
LSRKGGSVAGLDATGDRTRREVYDRHIVRRPVRWVHSLSSVKSRRCSVARVY